MVTDYTLNFGYLLLKHLSLVMKRRKRECAQLCRVVLKSMVHSPASPENMLEMEKSQVPLQSTGSGALGVRAGNLCFDKSFSGSSVY